MIVINAPHIGELLCKKMALCYSISFDAATNHEDSYFDVRVRVRVKARVRNFDLLTISVHELHTGELYYNVVDSLLTSIFGDEWSQKLLLVAAGGIRYITKRLERAVTTFEGTCAAEFYDIWCRLHQLDLITLSIFYGFLKPCFRDLLLDLIS